MLRNSDHETSFLACTTDETKPLVKTVRKPGLKFLFSVPCFVMHCPITNRVESRIQPKSGFVESVEPQNTDLGTALRSFLAGVGLRL